MSHKIYLDRAPLNFDAELVEAFPALATCSKLTEASRILYGVKTLGFLVGANRVNVTALNRFFDGDHSSLTAWATHAKYSAFEMYSREFYQPDAPEYMTYAQEDEYLAGHEFVAHANFSFYALPEHRASYRLMVKLFGVPFAARATQYSDFADLARGIEFCLSTKQRAKRFQTLIIDELQNWPACVLYRMVHDYAVQAMQRAERATERKGKPSTAPATLPMRNLPAKIGEFTVLNPRNEGDLRRIGTAQRHCVGTKGMGYADKIRNGVCFIFALYTKTLTDGICVEFSLRSGAVCQAQGRHRRGPTDAEQAAIETIIAAAMAEKDAA